MALGSTVRVSLSPGCMGMLLMAMCQLGPMMPMLSVSGAVRGVPVEGDGVGDVGRYVQDRLQLVLPILIRGEQHVMGAGDLVDQLPVEVAQVLPGLVSDQDMRVIGDATRQVDLRSAAPRPVVPAVDPWLGTSPQNGHGWVPRPGEVGNSTRVLVLASPSYNSLGSLGLAAAS